LVVSPEIAGSRLRRLEQCVKRLARLAGMPQQEYLDDRDAQAIAERNFQIATQCLLDLGNHIIAEEGLGTPEDGPGILDCLAGAGIISPELHQRTRGLAGFRNILVHDYLAIDQKTVHRLLGRLDNLVDLGKALGGFVDRRASGR
jgi:uncharacterized protein YutE (UPF0331/DUF86 family)